MSATRIAVAFALALLGGCSCCTTPPLQTLTYVVDDATATRIGGKRALHGT